MARLEIDDIHVALGGAEILSGVSLDVAEGECVALLGPSGCGKTTTLRAIAGFAPLGAGDIRIGGRSVRGLPPHRRNLGLVFQDYALFPHMTVAENVAYGLRMRRTDRAGIARQVAEILELVQLSDMDDRLPAAMSGGQRQRVALARALVIRPDVLLLDEPLGALDRKLRDQMQVEFKRIQREVGITTIFVTHDQEEALSLSNRVAVMLEGGIREVGPPEALYQRPHSQDVMQFLGASNVVAGQVAESSGDGAAIDCEGGLRLHSATVVAAGKAVRLGVRPEHVAIVPAPAGADDNVLAGVVEERVYKGTHADLYVRLESGQIFAVHVGEVGAGEESGTDAGIGARVHLAIERRNVLIFE